MNGIHSLKVISTIYCTKHLHNPETNSIWFKTLPLSTLMLKALDLKTLLKKTYAVSIAHTKLEVDTATNHNQMEINVCWKKTARFHLLSAN
jgi:hypothetical protein